MKVEQISSTSRRVFTDKKVELQCLVGGKWVTVNWVWRKHSRMPAGFARVGHS